MKTKLLSVILSLLTFCVVTQAQTLAFPGAEGFGRFTTGGRGGKVIHVTNLKNSGDGSFRSAVGASGKKIVVFDVAGTIYLTSPISIPSNTTIAGQTSPGGICIGGYPVTIGGNNIIVRYISFRPGSDNVAYHEGDGLGSLDKKNLIIDHCSVSWSVDECLSLVGCTNYTVQWCTSTQSLVNSGHSKGAHGYGGNWGGSGCTWHHNLISHHTSRCPRLGPRQSTQTDERMDMRNCVMYNYGKLGCYGGEGMNVNIVNNYYKPGPASATDNYGRRIAGIGIRTSEYTAHNTSSPNGWDVMWHVWGKYYVTGNVNPKFSDVTNDNWTYGIHKQIDASGNDGTYTKVTQDTIRLYEPVPFVHVTTHTAEQAYEKVLAYAGNSLYRDKYDELIFNDVKRGIANAGTGKSNGAGFIDTQYDVKYLNAADHDDHFYPVIAQVAEAPTDTDGDGIPDEWETANGLNPNDAADGKTATLSTEGYTNVEVYLNSLVDKITLLQYVGGVVEGLETPEEAKQAWIDRKTTAVVNTTFSDFGNRTMPFAYNLSGQQVDEDYKGIVIKNGKKIIQ